MRTNIDGVSKKLTLGRGATLASSNERSVDFLQDALVDSLYANSKANVYMYQQIQGQSFATKPEDTFIYNTLRLADQIRFEGKTTSLIEAGDGTTLKSSLTIDVNLVNPVQVHLIELYTQTGYHAINCLPEDWQTMVDSVNYFFQVNSAEYPYQLELVGNTISIVDVNSSNSISKFSLSYFSDSADISYTSSDARQESFVLVSKPIAVRGDGSLSTDEGETDDILGKYEIQNDAGQVIGEISSTLTQDGKYVTSIKSFSPAQESYSYINLIVDADGNTYTETITPDSNDSSNKIATTAFVKNALVGGVVYKGTFDASAGNYDAIRDSKVGWMYYVNVEGIIDGIHWRPGDYLLVDADGATDVTKIDNTEDQNIVRLEAAQTLTNKTLISPSLTGTPTAPTAAKGTSTEQIASTEFVTTAIKDAEATIDPAPTESSANPVASSGIYAALQTKANLTDIPTKVSQLENDSGYIKEIPDTYVTKDELTEKDYVTNAALTTTLQTKADVTALDNYLTKEAAAKDYAPLEATTTALSNKADSSDLLNYLKTSVATETYLSKTDASDTYATKASLTDKQDVNNLSQIIDNSETKYPSNKAITTTLTNYASIDYVEELAVSKINASTTTSGAITLESNKVYQISLTGNTQFSLTEPADKTIYNQIKVMLKTTGTPTVTWGTSIYYNKAAPDISTDGNYVIYYDWDTNANSWVCGALSEGTV